MSVGSKKLKRLPKDTNEQNMVTFDDCSEDSVPHKLDGSDSDYVAVPSTSQNRITSTSTAIVAERTGTSDRSVAMIASAVLEDVGLIAHGSNSNVIDMSKVRRSRSGSRKKLKTAQDKNKSECIFFDGKIDET